MTLVAAVIFKSAHVSKNKVYLFTLQGMTLLTFSATVPGLKPACDSNGCHPTSAQTAACFIGLYLIALGTGGIKPCVSAFGADQFDENDDTERLKKSSFFNCFISQLILVHSLLLQRWFGFR